MNHTHTRVSKCRSCEGLIVWMKTARGANMPVDVDSVSEGDDLFDPAVHISHFSTCPDADKFRRAR